MEINRFDDVIGVVPTANIVEGRFVCLDTHTFSYEYGSRVDLPGAHVPSSSEEATRAKFCITFAIDNRPTPIMAFPTMDFALRGGFDQAANAPFATTVYLTHPGNQEGLTIPSGQPSIAYTDATLTLPSGSYVYSADIIKTGALLVIEYSGADAGKPKYASNNAVGVIGRTYGYDSGSKRLTVLID